MLMDFIQKCRKFSFWIQCHHPMHASRMFITKKKIEKNLSGKHAVIIGRSNFKWKPMAQLLLKENCTVTIVHSKTKIFKRNV